jgi:dihydroorotase-like cyclic amidohydrolase
MSNPSAKESGISFDIPAGYLFFNAERITAGDTRFKTSPPIREERNRELLLEMMHLSCLDSISTGHRLIPPKLKCLDVGDF